MGLKNIMINCSNISFVIKYEHVEAHYSVEIPYCYGFISFLEEIDYRTEVTHGQWLYRNVQVHDDDASLRKEEIIAEIEKQQEMGEEGLLPEDRYLLEINLDDMEITSGKKQEYWLLAIRAA